MVSEMSLTSSPSHLLRVGVSGVPPPPLKVGDWVQWPCPLKARLVGHLYAQNCVYLPHPLKVGWRTYPTL